MKPISLDELRRKALANGAELVMGGQSFNASRKQIAVDSRPAVEPVTAPLPDTLTRAEVEAMLDERDAHWEQQIALMTQAMVDAVKAATPVQPPPQTLTGWKFKPTYDHRGAIESIDGTPTYKD